LDTEVDHQCGFWCNTWTTDQIFCIHQIPQILEKNGSAIWQYISSS
jgi:hypothetical protein